MNYYNPMTNYYNNPYGVQQQIQSSLNGKIVDSIDAAKASDIPLGGYGIFPKADMSEIYIKFWTNNGTTQVATFKPDNPSTIIHKEDSFQDIENRIKELETKVNQLIEKKEVKKIEY